MDVVELAPSTLAQGLVAHWRFDEGQGNTANDSSGNLRSGTLTGGTWISDGRFGGALRLGNGEFVTVNKFPDATADYSVSAWVRINQYTQDTSELGQWGTIVSTELGSTGGWEANIIHNDPSPALSFGLWKGPSQGDYDSASCACLQLGRWTQVVSVVEQEKSKLSLYVDGQLRETSGVVRGILPGSPDLSIGQWLYGGRYLLIGRCGRHRDLESRSCSPGSCQSQFAASPGPIVSWTYPQDETHLEVVTLPYPARNGYFSFIASR